MQNRGIVEEAIRSYKKKRNEGDILPDQCRRRKLNSPVSLVPQEVVCTNGGANNDSTMEEFDQFVIYDTMKKGVEVLNQNDRENIGSAEFERTTKHPISGEKLEEIVQHESGLNSQKISSGDEMMQLQIVQQEIVHHESGDEMEDVESVQACEENDATANVETSVEEELIDNDEEYLFPTPDEISNAKPPEVGMVFTTLEESVRFVNAYAQLTGFSVIKARNYKNRKITLCCNKCRRTISRSLGQRQRKRRTIGRTGCQVNVTVKLVETKWHIISLFLEHNHELSTSPSLTKFFLSHRTMSSEEKMLSELLQEIRVKPQRIMTIFRRLKGTSGNVTFGKRKLDNLKQADRKLKQNSDVQCTLKYIGKLQLTKPGFCCKMEVDATTNAVRSIFWTDARSRLDYKLYGDIICFDTTYSTNKYNMPFAPIIGVNGHGKTIVFGWALLKNQKADTFEWLFESLVEVMEGKKPKLILTDQDGAMKNAILAMFPDAWHRFCIWHILKNLRENMSSYMAQKEGMEKCIVRLIVDSLNVTEFETGWKEMLITYDCAEHDHLKRMWDDRTMFVPAYFKDSFCPFTRTTGRSESFNSNFKEYVLRKDTIENFLKRYELFQENVIEIENEDRFQSTQQVPVLWCRQLIERHAARVYTKGIYVKFVTELLNSTAFGVNEIVKDKVYELKKLFYYERPEYRRDLFVVCVDRKTMTIECECGKYQKDGILCCHILRLFTQWDVVEIPEQYIMPRWTSEFREKELLKHKQEVSQVHGSSSSQNAVRYAMLMNSMNDVCADISRDSEKSKEFIEEVMKLHKRLMTGTVVMNQQDARTATLKDPPVIKKASAKKSKEVVPKPNAGRSVSIWVKEDGTVTQPVEIQKKTQKGNPKTKKRKEEEGHSSPSDPPVSNSKSVIKGDRMKPQSEKNSKRRRISKKSKTTE